MENSIRWLSAEIDTDFDLFLSNYNPLMLKDFKLPKEIDGFFFHDKEGYVFLFDKKNNQGAYLDYTPRSISFREDKLVHRQRIGNDFIFFDKKVVIKDSKKFYFIYSKKQSDFLIQYFMVHDLVFGRVESVFNAFGSLKNQSKKILKQFSSKKKKA